MEYFDDVKKIVLYNDFHSMLLLELELPVLQANVEADIKMPNTTSF